MRKRVPGYITTEHTNDFGLDVRVQRAPFPKADMPASGDPVPEGQDAGRTQRLNFNFRNPIPPGEIGSQETEDIGPLTPPQYVDTVGMSQGETRSPDLHGSVNSLRTADREIGFNEYASFQPRRAPMPRNASDSMYLAGYGKNVADPRMSDDNATENIRVERGRPDIVDLFGQNRDGMAHNENPTGFAAVRPAPGVAKKAPRMGKVKG